ncbi:winged helix-turn-helix domain-containing protein [Streptomyces sp. NPDC016845]|uniref:winged helix-turn-helix domain-containing protein n=1 Tax=Streptomyces sp. NPDC016845 TaxID=3364972 RepID=UPI00379821F1
MARGPAHGRPDQTWTLARIKTLIGRRFHKSMTLSAIAQMRRNGFSHQVPVRHAVERDEEVVAGWRKETWPQAETARRRATATPQSACGWCVGTRTCAWLVRVHQGKTAAANDAPRGAARKC